MAQVKTLINNFGKMTGWNNVTCNMMGRDVVGIASLEYTDNVSDDNIMGQGDMPIGFGQGNYEAKFAIELYVEEMNAIQQMLPPGMRVSDIAPFDVMVEYNLNGKKMKDRVRNVRILGRGKAVKQGDKSIIEKPPTNLSHIDWNIL